MLDGEKIFVRKPETSKALGLFIPFRYCATSVGRRTKEMAKMMGITPAWLTRRGRYEGVVPKLFPVRVLRAYSTGTWRTASLIKTTPAITMSPRAAKMAIPESPSAVVERKVRPKEVGKFATIPAKMSIEIPFPMPFSVRSSPSHIKNSVPAESETIRVIKERGANFPTTPCDESRK